MIIDPGEAVLVVFCRRPKLGYGKQRLAQAVGQPIALQVANFLLQAALADARNWPGRVVLSPADAEDTDWARALLPGAEVMAQPTGGLGSRISQIDTRVRATGAAAVLFIGTDAPGMRDQNLRDALAALEHAAAVFIPAADGGVTLLGANKSWPQLDDLPWETNSLFPALLRRCESVGWRCSQLETGYDIDTLADLLHARADLGDDTRPSRMQLCAWLDAAKLEALPKHPAKPRANSVAAIVPVYHDATALEQLLSALKSSTYQPDEIIVVDGSASAADTTAHANICARFDARHYQTQPCRGSQLHFGATLARCEILWFLHADAGPPDNALQIIRQQISTGCNGGFFRFSFTGPRTFAKDMLAKLINTRALIGTPYGDQGLFMRADAYFDAGGFAPEPLFEEVPLVRELRRRGEFKPVDAAIRVSTRRWERDGWLQRTVRNRMLAIRYMLGTPAAELVRAYRPELPQNAQD